MRTKWLRSLIWLLPCHLVTLSPCHPVTAQTFDPVFDPVIDSPMYQHPELPAVRVVTVFTDGKALWLRALARPEADLKCQAANAIARAHGRGVKGLQTTIRPLIAALDQPDQHPTVRLAVARALITLEARQAAPSLFKQSQSGGNDLRAVVEPVLARWDYRPARAVWLRRLRQPAAPSWSLILAIRGLATVREAQAADPLRALVRSDRTTRPIRLEAARALGAVRPEGLEQDAERLAGDPAARARVDRLAAAALLHRHRSAAAVRLLQQLMRDPEPAVAAPAVTRLIEIDPKLVVPALEHLLARPDAGLRSLAVTVLRRQPSAEHVRLLADRLDDPHPDVRVSARKALRELAANKDLRKSVIAEASRVLAAAQWRGLEQATILLTQLDHKPAASRLVQLLTVSRPEVYITAAWGLRKLAVPETLPDVLAHVDVYQRRLRAAANNPQPAAFLLDHQLSQLNQLLGEQRHQPADAVDATGSSPLRRFIPRMQVGRRPPLGAESRAAAIWALGRLHEGKAEPALVTALEGRLNDPSIMPPEFDQVRRMSGIALGRMKARSALPTLRRHYPQRKPSGSTVNNACGWAIAQITGKAMPAAETIRKSQRDEFLTPFK
jgi:HEAT repeat protein